MTGRRAQGRHAPFVSELGDPADRFLSHAIHFGLALGMRRPDEFLAAFPPGKLAAALADAPELRARMLEIGLGMPRSQAWRKPAAMCGIQLQHALDRGELDAAVLVQLIRPDDRIRYLDRAALWKYVRAEGLVRVRQGDAEGIERARKYLLFLLERALADGVVTDEELSAEALASATVELLPRERVVAIVAAALAWSHEGRRPGRSISPVAARLGMVPLIPLWHTTLEPRLRAAVMVERPRPVPVPSTGVPTEILDDAFTHLRPHRNTVTA